MKDSTSKLITSNRVIQLLESYGARTNSWPEEERTAALILIEKSPELKQLLHDAQDLDKAMAITEYEPTKHPTTNSPLVSRILSKLPEQGPIRRKVKIFRPKPWFNSEGSNSKWFNSEWFNSEWFGNVWQHSGLLATGIAMTLVIVVLSQPQPSKQYDSSYQLAQLELDQWLWEDVTGETQNIDEEVLDFMTLAGVERMDDYEE